jgi:hypothetical protein
MQHTETGKDIPIRDPEGADDPTVLEETELSHLDRAYYDQGMDGKAIAAIEPVAAEGIAVAAYKEDDPDGQAADLDNDPDEIGATVLKTSYPERELATVGGRAREAARHVVASTIRPTIAPLEKTVAASQGALATREQMEPVDTETEVSGQQAVVAQASGELVLRGRHQTPSVQATERETGDPSGNEEVTPTSVATDQAPAPAAGAGEGGKEPPEKPPITGGGDIGDDSGDDDDNEPADTADEGDAATTASPETRESRRRLPDITDIVRELATSGGTFTAVGVRAALEENGIQLSDIDRRNAFSYARARIQRDSNRVGSTSEWVVTGRSEGPEVYYAFVPNPTRAAETRARAITAAASIREMVEGLENEEWRETPYTLEAIEQIFDEEHAETFLRLSPRQQHALLDQALSYIRPQQAQAIAIRYGLADGIERTPEQVQDALGTPINKIYSWINHGKPLLRDVSYALMDGTFDSDAWVGEHRSINSLYALYRILIGPIARGTMIGDQPSSEVSAAEIRELAQQALLETGRLTEVEFNAISDLYGLNSGVPKTHTEIAGQYRYGDISQLRTVELKALGRPWKTPPPPDIIRTGRPGRPRKNRDRPEQSN